MLIDKLKKQLSKATEPDAPGASTAAALPTSGPEPDGSSPGGRHRSTPDSSSYAAAYKPLQQALSDDTDPIPAAAAAGRRLAERGIPLADALDALECTYSKAGDAQPPFKLIRALCQSWTECTLTYLHAPSCEDPGTGLATTPHLRSRLNDLYRTAERRGWYMPDTHTLVIAEPFVTKDDTTACDAQLANLADRLRTVFKEAEFVARLGPARVAAVVPLDPQFTEQLDTLRSMVNSWQDGPVGEPRTKVWTEKLPTLAEWSDTFVNDLAVD
jgi:hypothetical protein